MSKYSALRFPRLLELSLRQENSFWSTIFESLAYGKSPYGSYVTNSNFLVGKNKGNTFTYDLNDPEKSLDTLNKELKDILSTNLNLMSKGDRVMKIDTFNNVRGQLISNFRLKKWNDIRRKSIRDLLLEMYVIKISGEKHISLQNTHKILSSLLIAFMFKRISNDQVTVDNFEIKNIRDVKLSLISNGGTLNLPTVREEKGCAKVIKNNNELLQKKWMKLFA